MGHVVEGNLSLPKNNCFLRLPMYCPVRNFMMQVFCESVMFEFFQKALES